MFATRLVRKRTAAFELAPEIPVAGYVGSQCQVSRTREFTWLRLNTDQADRDQKFYVYFHRPADVNKMVFMVWKHLQADDNRWLYLPALDLVKRIAATDERTAFVGSDFFYEDVSGRTIHEDRHELLDTTEIKAKMSDQRSGGSTQIEYSNITYQFDIPEDVFSERYLRRAPTEYLH